ncbi:MAG: Asp23/Gls24 family envelope stress response protein, partial [Hamadaea sp.]|nr:Asp23/Gls24 family envelope stress response protein [Hamadaea sp.]
MTAPAVTPGQLTDDVDVDAIVEAVRRCPGVEDLYAGSPVELATYLPGRRVAGVRVTDSAVEVQIRTRWGRTIPEIGAAVLAAVAPLAGGRPVDVLVADV